ncbi:MAG: adenylyl-sulfate kinase [Coriobacteriia bacterium]
MSSEDKGVVVWMTGLSGAGKTTISTRLREILVEEYGRRVEVMDGDEIRKGLSADLGFSKEDRSTHAQRVQFVSKLLSRNGVIVLVALISPYAEFRQRVREDIEDFIEVFVDTPLETCIERDPKGLYKKALAGEIKDMTGLDDPYEPPTDPELVVKTEECDVEGAARQIIEELERRGYLNGTSV